MIPGYGSTRLKEEEIASAATITVKADLVRLTGTTNVATIYHPLMLNRGGLLIFVYTVGAGLDLTGGNILVPLTLVTNKVYALIYSAKAGKWIPQGT